MRNTPAVTINNYQMRFFFYKKKFSNKEKRFFTARIVVCLVAIGDALEQLSLTVRGR